MNRRSLKSSATGQAKAKQAIQRKGWTQDYLATQAGLSTRNSVWKFVTGRPIERSIFIELCFQLDLDWQEIADLPQEAQLPIPPSELDGGSELDELLPTVRANLRGSIQAQCATLESPFDVTQPLLLEQIYGNRPDRRAFRLQFRSGCDHQILDRLGKRLGGAGPLSAS